MLIVRSIKADIRRENYKEDEVNFKIGTAISLFGRNERKLGAEDRGDGEERKTVREGEVNLKISNAISLLANVPSVSGLLSIPFRTRVPGPRGDAATRKADSFTTLRTFKEPIHLRFSRKVTTTCVLRERFSISSSSSCLKSTSALATVQSRFVKR